MLCFADQNRKRVRSCGALTSWPPYVSAGPKAVARRILSGCAQALAPAAMSRNFASLQTDEELQSAGACNPGMSVVCPAF